MSELNDAMDWIGLDARAHIESGDASVKPVPMLQHQFQVLKRGSGNKARTIAVVLFPNGAWRHL